MTEAFLKYLKHQKRGSAHTELAYRTDLNQFGLFLQTTFEVSDPAAADHGMIRSWIISLMESGLEPASVNRKIACLRTFYKFLLRNQAIRRDPTTKIRVLKTRKRLPSFVKETEMISLLDGDLFEDSFEGMRDRLLFELFYGTGIRLSELVNLRDTDINFRAKTIKVLGKRNKERVIPVADSIIPLVRRYTELREAAVPAKYCNNLFVTQSGKPLYPVLVNRVVKKYLSVITTAAKKSPHVLRHTYATHLLDKGAGINAVKDLLGHASLAATQVYTHNSLEKLKKVFEQAHPKA